MINKPIFVISDLHIGDGSPRDNLSVTGREDLLYRFLDYVDHEQGRLIIAGDLFEFWRYRLDKVLNKRAALLDRLDSLHCMYITGNHDSGLWEVPDITGSYHSFFDRMRKTFMQTIGSKRFKFMHGHEVDPFIPVGPGYWSKWFRKFSGAFSGVLEMNSESLVIHKDLVTDSLYECGEVLLKVWESATLKVDKTMREYASFGNDKFAWLKRSLRTRRMLSRYYDDKKNDLYDIAIVGHTHKATRFSNWYYNSGSWTGKTNNFMMIQPDAAIRLYDWTSDGPIENMTSINNFVSS